MYEILIKNGRIVDGSGNPWYKSDIAIDKGRIAEIGRIAQDQADRIIDASGLFVAPGFIDVHNHSDVMSILNPQMESNLLQGITTVIVGNCGASLAPINPSMKEKMQKLLTESLPSGVDLKITWTTFAEYLEVAEKSEKAVNTAHLVGHGTIREAVVGFDAKAPTEAQLCEMKELTREAMEAGAYGISTGLIYPPGMYAKTSEAVELARVAASHGGVYASHIRGEGRTLLKAVKEVITIGEKAGIAVHIAHHKAFGKAAWGKSVHTLRMMERARNKGVDITFDQYPYAAGETALTALLPPWVHDGGKDRMLERLEDSEQLSRIKEDIRTGLSEWESIAHALGWKNIIVNWVKSTRNKKYEGKNMTEIKNMRGDTDELEVLRNLLLEERGEAAMIIFAMQEEDIKRIMKHPLGMVGTDSSAAALEGTLSLGKPHPRYFGTYPRILGKYVRVEKVLHLEEAIRKMTSFPAQTFGILDRGLLRPGMRADITLFDPETIADNATYKEPHVTPTGIPYVLVNGVIAVKKGKCTGDLAGHVLKKREFEITRKVSRNNQKGKSK